MDGLRERERGKSGESERLGEASATGAAQMVHSAVALIPLTRLHSANEVWERGSWGREENEGEREVREGREKKNKKIVWDEGMEREGFGVQGWGEKGEERKVRVRLREREGNGWVERKRERKEWGVREVGRGECCTGAAQMVHREKGEERKVRVRLREREGNGWVERKRERKEWGVREVGRGECCTGAAQMVHSAAALIPLTRLHSANEVWERGSWEERRMREKERAAQMVHSAVALIPSYSAFTPANEVWREGSWGREENEGEREEKKGEERKVRVRLREREGNGWVERKRERKEWGVREVGRGECCTGAAQMVHSAAALIPLTRLHSANEEKKGEERKVRVRLREREGNGWVERKRERKEWGVREVGRGECCTGAAQMVHSAASSLLLAFTLRMKCGREGREKGEERKVRVRLREREGNGWVERKRERKEWGVREVGRGECCTGAAQMVHSAVALIPSTRLHSANEEKKGEERKVRVRLREREGNGWVERKRERKEWGVREVGRGECCTGAAQMVHSAVALILLLAFTL
ncbi:uncharacterized protein MONOS_18352 [Monocercomonoides exilis]|uniref:uncharacterized protein n=1 Tax=Monocercomonoides exilis TaxID=2049356 RepID=UPI0035595711|nr:hypothetical protein MONOS_18352 [Monocercomonoides exilis]